MTKRKGSSDTRRVVKNQIVMERGMISELSGDYGDHLDLDLHEVFVQRSDLPGRGDDLSSKYNCVLVTNEENINMSQEQNVELGRKLIKRYGEKAIQQWIKSLKMKYPPDVSKWG